MMTGKTMDQATETAGVVTAEVGVVTDRGPVIISAFWREGSAFVGHGVSLRAYHGHFVTSAHFYMQLLCLVVSPEWFFFFLSLNIKNKFYSFKNPETKFFS